MILAAQARAVEILTPAASDRPKARSARLSPHATRRLPSSLAQKGVCRNLVTVRIPDRAEAGTLRFSELRRGVGDVSQRMLSQTVRRLEEDGLVAREVMPTVPPRVRYSLTDLGHSLLKPVRGLVAWADANRARIHAARVAFRKRQSTVGGAASS